MDIFSEYQRDLANPTAMRVASHFKNAARRLGSVMLTQAVPTQAAIEAQAQDISYMTADALALLPVLENVDNPALYAPVAALTAQMQQMNAQMQQMNAQLTAQMQQMNVQINGRLDVLTLAMNSNSSHLTDAVLLPFANQNQFIPEIFPRSSEQLMALTGPQMTELLNAYNIYEVPHLLRDRMKRVKELINTGQ